MGMSMLCLVSASIDHTLQTEEIIEFLLDGYNTVIGEGGVENAALLFTLLPESGNPSGRGRDGRLP